ncbi:hypothetical protein LAUMK191_04196 [Mycobacterium attenuatum]|uniref:Uncharacterized protein n=1 Tax=Mycobacterium attenuatum TaxID=2341086 RepID=A0A498Q8M1_9MYCO|nr:hypothetical protein LAUMK136_04196 [Mycobacterium attenuatum]VBA57799.1 hypothetical protein LAUMK191_04196 [Mycobacterium attenuatum]VBA60943.1 hypothetical protein LAUMK41_04315 [Mycobacterium attenuatum]
MQGFFGFDDTVRSGFQEVRVVIRVTGPKRRNAIASCSRQSTSTARVGSDPKCHAVTTRVQLT